MAVPSRLERQEGRHASVDGIQFSLPVVSSEASAMMAAFPIDLERAAAMLPGNELHPLRLGRNALLVVTVIDYRRTSIGSYIEYSIAIACTRGKRPAPPLIPGLLQKAFGVGQYVLDLPVSTEISVKGGKGIWGMPKHRAPLDFKVSNAKISAQYDLDSRLAAYVEIANPGRAWLPINLGASNYCVFRGMLMKSTVYFRGKAAPRMGGDARFIVGDHPRVKPLKELGIGERAVATVWLPEVRGVLDDHIESWFVHGPSPIVDTGEGLESIYQLGQSEEWPPPPSAEVPGLGPTHS
jgi:hypothetical protein